jgi:hypothetical protein
LQQHFPTVEPFNGDNFAKCPLHLIVEALNHINEEKLATLAQQSTPLSLVGVALMQVNGAKGIKPDAFNPFPKMIRKREVKQILNKEAAAVYLRLRDENKLPPWVSSVPRVIEDCNLLLETE